MRALGPTVFCLLACACPLAGPLQAQVAAAGVASPLYRGFQIPTVKGTLSYSVSASESASLDYDGTGQTAYFSSISGNFAFLSPSAIGPTSIVYSGGYQGSNLDQPSSFFHNISVQQILNTKFWKFSVIDTANYLPNSPSTGFSGIPGVGDLGVVTSTAPQQAELSPYAVRIDNSLTLQGTRSLTGKTSIFFSGAYLLERYPGQGGGVETNTYSGAAGASHSINGRSSLSTSYSYTQFKYLQQPGAFVAQGASLSYSRTLTRSLQVSLGGGPQYIQPGASTGASPMLSYSANARLAYAGSVRSATSAAISFVHSTNSGSGFTFGAQNSTFSFNVTRRFLRSLQISAQLNYGRNTGLQYLSTAPLSTDTLAAGIQANRALSRTISAFVSYSAQQQTSSGTASVYNYVPVEGLSHSFSGGLTYSPRPYKTGR
jgi:hypothetical protein